MKRLKPSLIFVLLSAMLIACASSEQEPYDPMIFVVTTEQAMEITITCQDDSEQTFEIYLKESDGDEAIFSNVANNPVSIGEMIAVELDCNDSFGVMEQEIARLQSLDTDETGNFARIQMADEIINPDGESLRPSGTDIDLITFTEGDAWRMTIKNCPTGRQATKLLDLDLLGPNGARFRGGSFLQEGDTIVRTWDCGNGDDSFILGTVIGFNDQYTEVTVEAYDPPIPTEGE